MQEQDLFVEDASDIRVTTARIVVPGQTIAVRGITAIRSANVPPNRLPGMIAGSLGALVALAGLTETGENRAGALALGGVLVLVGLFLALTARGISHLTVVSASGETYTFRDEVHDKQGLKNALNAAIMLAAARP